MSTDDKFRAGLDDQDEMSQFPSAANPLSAMGIDPDEARANPDLLEKLRNQAQGKPNPSQAVATATAPPVPPRAAVSMPADDNKPSASAVAAGKAGGAAAPAPATTPTTTAEPTDPEGYGLAGLGKLNSEMDKASQAGDQISTDTPADVAQLTARREKLATPAPRFDAQGKQLTATQEFNPQTGQMETINPKASTGQKVWRGVRGGLVGLLTGGLPGAALGAIEPQDIAGGKAYNAPSKQYDQAEQRREQALGATDTGIKTALQAWKDVNESRKAKAGEHRATAALGKDLTAGATGLINAENKPESEERKADAKLKLNQQEFDQRKQQVATDPQLSRLSPLQKMLYMANGKLPDPQNPTEASLQAQNMARALVTWKASHGGKAPQTLEEFNQVVASAKGDLDKGGKKPPSPEAIADSKNAAIEKANSEFAKKLFTPGARDSYQRQLQTIQNAYEEDMKTIGLLGDHNEVTVDAKNHVTWTPRPAAPAVPAAQNQQPSVKPQPAPDGTRRQTPKGTIEVKRGGQWVSE